jgi:hypothetical protein
MVGNMLYEKKTSDRSLRGAVTLAQGQGRRAGNDCDAFCSANGAGQGRPSGTCSGQQPRVEVNPGAEMRLHGTPLARCI